MLTSIEITVADLKPSSWLSFFNDITMLVIICGIELHHDQACYLVVPQADNVDRTEKKSKASALVRVQPLQLFVEQQVGAQVVKLMKMDTEGSEIDILKSGLRLIQSGQVGVGGGDDVVVVA